MTSAEQPAEQQAEQQAEQPMGVSFVVPVYNGARTLHAALAAILAQSDGRPFEVLVIDDGSADASRSIAETFTVDPRVRVVAGPGRGAAAALNCGIRLAASPIICQVDQDVVLEPGWLAALTGVLAADPTLGAAQGLYLPTPQRDRWARLMSFDLSGRYAAIGGDTVDHVCSGNSAYRAAALRQIGLFDESFGYAYDNDVSYRLAAAGRGLAFCRQARSVHYWREGLRGYLAQQYGVGYGRLDLVAKHRARVRGDRVSGPNMILHAAAMTIAVGLFAIWAVCAFCVVWAFCGGCAICTPSVPRGEWAGAAGLAIVGALALERLVAGARLVRGDRIRGALLFAGGHLLRDLAWTVAIARWTTRRLTRQPRHPAHSMGRARVISKATYRERDTRASS